MSDRSRNRNYRQNRRKNANNSVDSSTYDSAGENGSKNQNFRSKNSKDMRPIRSQGMKSHGATAKPMRPNTKSGTKITVKVAPGKWIWGYHAVFAAIANPKRSLNALYVSKKMAERMKITPRSCAAEVYIVRPSEIDALLPEGAVHQGVALSCAPLGSQHLDEITKEARGLILVLDQITDPHNVGAIFRLAKAFNANGIVMQSRHAPPLMGATAKVAVGTVETVPHVLVTNIANTLLTLQKYNWRVTGLAGEAKITLQQALVNSEAEIIVMGAEGPGLRKRVRDCCDQLAKIPMPGGTESLNVSTAAAIALYETVRSAG
ncbi:MAG: 23S rRNA (guanosine(2251)-2'-O)-methyltransferase RlmB [Robiginitomaculum sp.]